MSDENWTYNDLETRLRTFENEKVGWDGYDGEPASPAVGKDVRALLEAARVKELKPPSIAMGSDGSVAVVWNSARHYIAADCCGDGVYVFIVADGEDFILDGVNSVDAIHPDLLKVVSEFFPVG